MVLWDSDGTEEGIAAIVPPWSQNHLKLREEGANGTGNHNDTRPTEDGLLLLLPPAALEATICLLGDYGVGCLVPSSNLVLVLAYSGKRISKLSGKKCLVIKI